MKFKVLLLLPFLLISSCSKKEEIIHYKTLKEYDSEEKEELSYPLEFDYCLFYGNYLYDLFGCVLDKNASSYLFSTYFKDLEISTKLNYEVKNYINYTLIFGYQNGLNGHISFYSNSLSFSFESYRKDGEISHYSTVKEFYKSQEIIDFCLKYGVNF